MKQIILCIILIFVFMKLPWGNLKTSQDANIRAEPTLESDIKGIVPAKTVLNGKLAKDNNDWYEISKDGKGNKINGYIHGSLVTKKINWKKTIIIIIMCCIIFSLIADGIANQCPKCKKLWARKKLSTEFEDSDVDYETVTRTDVMRNKRGEEIGTTERQEQVRMKTNYYRVNCRCKKCGHEWYYFTSQRFEG